jgi:hypothetical protein
MDVIRLRTLTKKSLMGFGKYAECTVQQVINLQKVTYLVYVYFHLSGITFEDKLLDELNIYIEDRIIKPGTNPEKYEEILHKKKSSCLRSHTLDYYKKKSRNHKLRKNDLIRKEISSHLSLRKGILQSKNQGH